MKYLLDTNVFVWSLQGSSKLKRLITEIIQNPKNQIFVSVISGIEISIKTRNQKLKIKTTVEKMFEISGFEVLNVNLNHVLELNMLPLHKDHKDPFDRMLVSQAKVEKLTLITSDPKIWKYKISLVRA